jgi:flagellar protein FliL
MIEMAEAAPATDPVAETPKKKSKLPMIIIAAVVACAAIGGGAFFFMSGNKHEEAPKGKDAKSSVPKAPAVYVKLDPPFVVNFEAKGVMRFLQITLEIMTRDPVTADKIKESEPVIRNDLLMLFGTQTYDSISTREGKEKLRSEAKDTVAKIVGREGGEAKKVEDLFFTSFVMQ